MHDKVPVNQSSPNLTRSQEKDRVLVTLVAVGIVIALTAVVVMMRLYRLSDFPPGIINDEGANGVDALQVLQGDHNVFFAEKASGREALAIYAIALATLLLGPSLLAFHLAAGFGQRRGRSGRFLVGLLLFGEDEQSGNPRPWRGLAVAGIGAGLMAASIGQTFLARGGFRANFLPLILTLSLALLWRSWGRTDRRKASWWGLALAGASAGPAAAHLYSGPYGAFPVSLLWAQFPDSLRTCRQGKSNDRVAKGWRFRRRSRPGSSADSSLFHSQSRRFLFSRQGKSRSHLIVTVRSWGRS